MSKNIDRIELNQINDPNIVKTLSYEQLKLLCEDIRHEIILKTSIYGGHLSSNLGVVELTVALHRVFVSPTDKIIFDVGHQCYTNKILTGRSLNHLNEKGYTNGFQNRSESSFDVYEAGHSSTSLSAAEGFAIARDLKHENYDVVAVIGDASIVNGLAFEALNDIGSRKHKVIIVLNDNEMSISSPTGALGKMFRKISFGKFYNDFKRNFKKQILTKHGFKKKMGDLAGFIKDKFRSVLVPNTIFDNMGFRYIGPVDGHNIKALEKAFNEAKNTDRSVVIHVRTIKGKGYEFAENDKLGYWHGVTPFDINTGRPLKNNGELNTWSHHMGDLAHHEMGIHSEAHLIVPAMVRGSGLEAIFDDFPQRAMDVGIAEEHALTLAGAMSLSHIHPIVTIYSTFLQRAYDELLHDCARMNTDMTLLIDRAGLVGKNGATHQGFYDESFLKSIPNVILTMPSTLASAKSVLDESFVKGHGVFGIRYPHSLMSVEQQNYIEKEKLNFGEPIIRREAKQFGVNVVAVGPLGFDLFQKTKDLEIGFIDPLYLNPISDALVEPLLKSKHIVIYDPYGSKNGFAESLVAKIMEKGYLGKITVFAVGVEFVEHASTEEQLQMFHLDLDEVISFIKDIL